MTSGQDGVDASRAEPGTPLHLPSLLTGLALMLVGSIDPRLLADSQGHADHAVAGLAMWAMSAGIVHGVGFVPKLRPWRILFSGWACLLALVAAVLCRFGA